MVDDNVVLCIYNLNRAIIEIGMRQQEIDSIIDTLNELKIENNKNLSVIKDNMTRLYEVLNGSKTDIKEQSL